MLSFNMSRNNTCRTDLPLGYQMLRCYWYVDRCLRSFGKPILLHVAFFVFLTTTTPAKIVSAKFIYHCFAFIIALLQIGHTNSLVEHGPHALSPLRGSHRLNAKSRAREKSTSPNTNNQKYPIVSAIKPPSSGIK